MIFIDKLLVRMISSQQALDETIRILKSNLPDVSGEEGSSHAYGFYQVAKNIFVKFRVADHGLYMQTFVSHQNGVPPELVSIISVVYRDKPKKAIGTKWKTKGYPKQITVYQYVYPCWDMDIKDIAPIAMELIKFAKTNRFIPPHLCTKDVKVQEIISDTGVRDITNQMKAQYCTIDESIITNDNKRYKNMNRKNTVRLTESELKNIITESVKNILKEGGALDVIRNVKSKDEKRKVRDLTRRVLKPQDIQDAFMDIERVLDEISYLDDPRISIHYLGDLRKKVQSLKQEFSMATSNLAGSVANHFANPWSQDRTTYKYRPTNEIPVDDTEQDSWYDRNEHGDFDEF